MTACISCWLYLLRDKLENLIEFSNASRSKYSRQETRPGIIFHLLYT